MKIQVILVLFCFSNVVVWSQNFTLSINKGYGSGTYQKGDTIFIWSYPEHRNLTFNEWRGSASPYMLEGKEWLTRLVVPIDDTVSNINTTAFFKDLSHIVKSGYEKIILPGMDDKVYIPTLKKVFYQIPKNPKGIIFCFHDSGESGEEFETDFEKHSFFKAGANQDYIMIATDANEKTYGDQDTNEIITWQIKNSLTDNKNNNIDIRLVKILRDTFINRFKLPNDFPTFSMGVSNGADFGDLCAAALQFNASGHMIGNGLVDIYKNRPDATPVIFIQPIKSHYESEKIKSGISNHELLINRKIYSEFHWINKTPLYPEIFLRTENLKISREISDSIFQRAKRYSNLLDKFNMLQIKKVSEIPKDLFDNLGLPNKFISDCINQLKVTNTENIFHSNFNKRILDFFNFCQKDSNNTKKREKNTSISVVSTSGEILYQVEGITEIDMKPFPNGVYFVKKVNSGQTTVKIVVKDR